jgi:hypothetical protein
LFSAASSNVVVTNTDAHSTQTNPAPADRLGSTFRRRQAAIGSTRSASRLSRIAV